MMVISIPISLITRAPFILVVGGFSAVLEGEREPLIVGGVCLARLLPLLLSFDEAAAAAAEEEVKEMGWYR